MRSSLEGTAAIVTLHNKRVEQEVAPEQTTEPGKEKRDIEAVPPLQAFRGLETGQN
jgi:hypothetical protein